MIQIKLNQKEYKRILKGLRKIRQKVNFHFVLRGGEMNRKCAIGYTQLLVKNIMTEKYASGYASYHPRYRVWKRQYAPGKGFWRLKDDLVRNLGPFRQGNGWMGGVPAGALDTGGKSWFGKGDIGKRKPMAMYATINERKRPIFEPTMDEFALSAWPEQAGLAMKDIERAWTALV